MYHFYCNAECHYGKCCYAEGRSLFSFNSGQFCNFKLSLLQLLKFFGQILGSFELQKFQTQNTKAMVKDKKVNIAVT